MVVVLSERYAGAAEAAKYGAVGTIVRFFEFEIG